MEDLKKEFFMAPVDVQFAVRRRNQSPSPYAMSLGLIALEFGSSLVGC